MTGTIKALKKAVPGQSRKGTGYGFITDERGDDRFFQHGDVEGTPFDQLEPGLSVEFEPDEGPRGPRANRVRVVA